MIKKDDINTVITSSEYPVELSSDICSLGSPGKDHTVNIVNPDDCRMLGERCIGEVWCQGPSAAQGYWGNELATEETFHAYTKDDQGPFLRTDEHIVS